MVYQPSYDEVIASWNNPEVMTDIGYRKIIDSWGFKGVISEIHLNSDNNILSFLHDGIRTSCPAEVFKAHKVKINIASRVELLSSSGEGI